VDSAFDQDKSELGILVLLVAIQVLSHGNSLLNQHVQILRDSRGKTCLEMRGLKTDCKLQHRNCPELTRLLEDSEDLVTSDTLHLGNAVGITENDTNLKLLKVK